MLHLQRHSNLCCVLFIHIISICIWRIITASATDSSWSTLPLHSSSSGWGSWPSYEVTLHRHQQTICSGWNPGQVLRRVYHAEEFNTGSEWICLKPNIFVWATLCWSLGQRPLDQPLCWLWAVSTSAKWFTSLALWENKVCPDMLCFN